MAVEVVLPMLGITVERGTITEWLKQEGDRVEKGEIIFIVEVEKATTEVESPASGILAKILVDENVEVPVLSTVAIITEPGEELHEEYTAASAGTVAAEPVPVVADSQAAPINNPRPAAGPLKAVPAARKLAADRNLDLSAIAGTGPQGVILVSDVNAASGKAEDAAVKQADRKVSTLASRLAEEKGVPLDQVEGTGVRGRIMREDVERVAAERSAVRSGADVIPMSIMRRVIARRMSESCFTAPHIYFFTEVAMDPLLGYRKSILPDFEERFGLRPSVNDFLIKAVSLNLVEFPIVNAQLHEEEIHMMPEINVCLAVALDEGLIVPALQRTDKAGLADIVRQRLDLVDRARRGKLILEEMERGTFTISSLSQYDITHFTAIINPPQSGILSVGKTREELYMEEGQVKMRRMATIGLAVDHRIIDGAVAADFLQKLKWKLESPSFTFMHA